MTPLPSTLTQHPARAKPGKAGDRQRREHILARLSSANPSYDELCREIAELFGEKSTWWASVKAVRAVRAALWDEAVTTEHDETLWLTAAGWAELAVLQAGRAS